MEYSQINQIELKINFKQIISYPAGRARLFHYGDTRGRAKG